MQYENPPTVAVAIARTSRGLILVRRGLADGFGKLALPGGYQTKGETWQAAVVRELEEETGAVVDASRVRLVDFVTVPSGHNLVFGEIDGVVADFDPAPDHETVEVVFAAEAVETAFPTHTDQVRRFFERT